MKAAVKRCLDAILALILIILLSPLLAVLWVMVRLRLGSPALFKQERPGLHGSVFLLYKFRSMTEKRDGAGNLLPDQERLTKFGKLLRQASLDELPELFNILKGDMSFVGPRPLLVRYLPRYSTEQARRHEVRPGLTGWAQVNGRNAVTWEEKFKLDVWYVDNWCLWLDLKILIKTVAVVLKRDGISEAEGATMSEFMGNSGEKE